MRKLTLLFSALMAASLLAGIAYAKKHKCECLEPCSGSKECDTGCWAFCEERESGPYCAKGCAAEIALKKDRGIFNAQSTFSSVQIKLPADKIKPLLENLFRVSLTESFTVKNTTKTLSVKLKKANLANILDSAKKKGVVLKQTSAPAKGKAKGTNR